MSLRTDIEELKRLEAKATPGEWVCFYKHKYDEWHVSVPMAESSMKLGLFRDGIPSDNPEHDAELIAAARNTLPRLIAQVERMESALKAAREDLFACGENSSAAWEHGDSSTRRLAEKQAAEIHSEIDEALKGMEE